MNIFGGPLSCLPRSTFAPEVCIHHTPSKGAQKPPPMTASTQSPKFYPNLTILKVPNLIIWIIWSLGEDLGMIPGAQWLSIYAPVHLENTVLAPRYNGKTVLE